MSRLTVPPGVDYLRITSETISRDEMRRRIEAGEKVMVAGFEVVLSDG